MTVVAAIGTTAAVVWWLGLALFVLLVVPAVVLLAWRLVQVVAEIRRYADDIRTHGAGLAEELESVAALEHTRALTGALRGGLASYADAMARIAGNGGRP